MAEAEQKAPEKLKLYAAPICPFAQRAWLALEAKKVPYEYVKCTLGSESDKEDYFKEAYAKAIGRDETNVGKVPIILTTDGKYITESAVVARYIDHKYCDEDKYGTPLLPSDPFERAAVETMVAWIGDSGWLRSHYGTLMQCDPDQLKVMLADWKKKWKILDQRLSQLSKEGLFLPSNKLSLFDICLYPFFERIITIEHYNKVSIIKEWGEECPRVKSWYEELLKQEAVKKVKQEEKFLIDGYKGYRERGEKKYKAEQEEKAKQAAADK